MFFTKDENGEDPAETLDKELLIMLEDADTDLDGLRRLLKTRAVRDE